MKNKNFKLKKIYQNKMKTYKKMKNLSAANLKD